MLVLTRRINEEIRIGDDIRIVLLEIRNNSKARIGIDAPRDVPVHRVEIYEAIQQENKRGRHESQS